MVNNEDQKKDSRYKIVEESGEKILVLDYENSMYSPSIENSSVTMAKVINIILENKPISRIVFLQREEYIYDENQTKMLSEIAELIDELVHKRNILDYSMISRSGKACPRCSPERYDLLRVLVMYELREDPIGAYFHLIDKINKETEKLNHPEKAMCSTCGTDNKVFLQTLKYIYEKLSDTSIIKFSAPYAKEYKPDDRSIYSRILKPIIKPNFLYTRVVTSYPTGAEELDSYKLPDGSSVILLRVPNDIRPLYHLTPPEFRLSEEKYNVLGEAREIITEHHPQKQEFMDVERTREVFVSVEKDLLEDLFRSKGIKINYNELETLAKILVRHTIGFGVLEIILSDPKVQDIAVNAPVGVNPVTIIHADYGECITNITITPREGEAWATKLRLMSGRPLDEANPVLDTNIYVPNARARVSAIQKPLSPDGVAFAFRRHRAKPWTTPLFIKNKMINPLAAGLLSFLVDGGRSILVAGTRSAGKTSVLSSLMTEIMRTTRVISVEDTLELPIHQLKKLGYDVQSMKVQSVITGGRAEVPAAEGIRASLRMGDSALIVGEVRSLEAKALWEAMRVGALANVVAGTIHGDSPYGVFDRVVNDLGVPKTSFKATDIIVIANPVKTASGLGSERRVVQITEVRKEWQDDPLRENGFVNLMEYNAETDTLEPTDVLLQGESSVLKAIGARVKEWAGDWDAIWQNIELRAKIKEELVKTSEKLKKTSLLEAEFVVASNDEFHRISKQIEEDIGYTDPDKIFDEWSLWLKKKIKTGKYD